VNEFNGLSKKERKLLAKELKNTSSSDKNTLGNILRKFILALPFLLLLVWVAKDIIGPKPGQAVADLGRGHVPLGTKIEYNSNPPTSGQHNENWIRPGVYDAPQLDEMLVHSLEHGYIIVSYNCFLEEQSLVPQAIAVESSPQATDSAQWTSLQGIKYDGEKWKKDQSCQTLKSSLEEEMHKLGLKRMILVPRPNLDTRIALTAWARIDKFDGFDSKRIEKFARAFHNKGPEQTME